MPWPRLAAQWRHAFAQQQPIAIRLPHILHEPFPHARFASNRHDTNKVKSKVKGAMELVTDPGPPILQRAPLAYQTYRWLKLALGIVIAGHLFVEYFYMISFTWGISMVPTMAADGGAVLTSLRERRGRDIAVGDVVAFRHPLLPREQMIKRVIGLEGDFVMRDSPHKGNAMMIQIPKGHCYVVGDNLDHSRDSRMFGPLPVNLIRGKVLYTIGRRAGFIPWFEPVKGGLNDALQDGER